MFGLNIEKIGDISWIIGLMKIDNMVNWTENNKPIDVPSISSATDRD